MRAPVEHHVCPFFHANELCCAERFTLERVSEVFQLCLGDHRQCRIFQELNQRDRPLVRLPLAQAG